MIGAVHKKVMNMGDNLVSINNHQKLLFFFNIYYFFTASIGPLVTSEREPRKTTIRLKQLWMFAHSLRFPLNFSFVFSRRKNSFVWSRTFSHSETVEKQGIGKKKRETASWVLFEFIFIQSWVDEFFVLFLSERPTSVS